MPKPPDRIGSTNYDKAPATRLPDGHRAWRGHAAWAEIAREAFARTQTPVVVVDTYPGVDVGGLAKEIAEALGERGVRVIDVEEAAARPIAAIDALIARNLTEDRVFGVMSHHRLEEFYDHDRLAALAAHIAGSGQPTVLVGWGAALVPVASHVVVLADLPRWEIQQRMRAGAPNWRCSNGRQETLRKYKRGFFVEWRVADRHKLTLFDQIDYVLDTTASVVDATLITAETFHTGLARTARRPFRVVPFFDPGPWGGQWMREVCGLDLATPNFAWCFDCVPEENSLYLLVDGCRVEVPAIDLVLLHPRELLGSRTHARFGAEFPIRFDFLDTMDGGNLSLQVHPLTGYIQDRFGMHYTQDESYYLLDAGPGASVYLGTRTGIDPGEMLDELAAAAAGERPFEADEFVNKYAARKHDHFLIPAGTIHCSGSNSMVLEISATPYIFTFKMWDWDRLGLDGRPRPIHLDHAAANIRWERDTAWVGSNLVNKIDQVDSGEGWAEERTGLHALEFIEVRRHWFTGRVPHDTHGTVNVLNLVEGHEAVIESPTAAFEPFVVHYAETFIVPAAVGPYTICPHGAAEGSRLATVKAYVRGTAECADNP